MLGEEVWLFSPLALLKLILFRFGILEQCRKKRIRFLNCPHLPLQRLRIVCRRWTHFLVSDRIQTILSLCRGDSEQEEMNPLFSSVHHNQNHLKLLYNHVIGLRNLYFCPIHYNQSSIKMYREICYGTSIVIHG